MITSKPNYPYPRQKINGIWLVIVGIAMMTLTIKASNGTPNATYFGILYALGMFWQLNSHTRQHLSIGPGTPKQNRWSNWSVILLFVLIALIFVPFMLMHLPYDVTTARWIWLLILLAVGIHFFAFVPVHGKLIGILGALTIINAGTGLLFISVPLNIFFVIDGLLKLIFGILYICLSPTRF